ncbi:phage antirepressor KilAC domain-containing protein [Lactobacillus gasseri]|jgi:anti-repressor|nr:phage antirepressor KilAC domain-containing protein [Lactobacillus gasseri]DAS72929.1 MAG TPA: antirepressor protein [Caudoviricetes sp.]MCZ3582261.1 phage antirepressor KilAC domain-containing protein [Lactobacillus gasseri]MCZ3584048.1 phage antirepressor KilAC domain-containing protein [Lactobacillus gasseri]MCZ3587660.1 phage antirepressor KilAC domain-containing protein [Lactobacillus gasseri]
MNNELIKVTVKNDQQLVSARDLYKGLGIKRRFSAWWEQNSNDFKENSDFQRVLISTPRENRGSIELQDYALTIDMAKQLCLLSRTKKGKEYREYLIEIEKKWNDPQSVVQRAMDILHSENLQLKLENKSLSRQLEESNKKASYLDVILGTTDAMVTTQIAMDYGYSAVKFNKLLHQLGIQHKVNGQWILYKAYMGKKYTTTKLHTYTDKHGKDHAKPLTAWTQKGRRLIYDILKENEVLPLIEREDIA